MPAVIEDEFAREAQVQLVDARQALDSGRLKDDGFGYESAPSIWNVEGLCWLNRKTRVMLEVHAGAEFPGKLVGAVDFEHIGGVEVQVVAVAVDVEVWVGEIVAGGLVREAAAIDAFLALNGEATKNLPFMRQALHRCELDRMIGVVIELRKVRHEVAEGAVLAGI